MMRAAALILMLAACSHSSEEHTDAAAQTTATVREVTEVLIVIDEFPSISAHVADAGAASVPQPERPRRRTTAKVVKRADTEAKITETITTEIQQETQRGPGQLWWYYVAALGAVLAAFAGLSLRRIILP